MDTRPLPPAPLPLAGDTVAIPVHFGSRTISLIIHCLVAGRHLGTIYFPLTTVPAYRFFDCFGNPVQAACGPVLDCQSLVGKNSRSEEDGKGDCFREPLAASRSPVFRPFSLHRAVTNRVLPDPFDRCIYGPDLPLYIGIHLVEDDIAHPWSAGEAPLECRYVEKNIAARGLRTDKTEPLVVVPAL